MGPGDNIGGGLDTLDTSPKNRASPDPSVDRRTGPQTVALNDIDYRVGETHHNVLSAAKPLSDADVERIRDEYEAHPLGHPEHVGYRALAKKWGVSKRTIRDIVEYKRRNQWVARWKRVAKV